MKREIFLSKLFMHLQVFSEIRSLLPAQGIKACFPVRNSICQGWFSLTVCRTNALPIGSTSSFYICQSTREIHHQHYKACTHIEQKLFCKGTKTKSFPFQCYAWEHPTLPNSKGLHSPISKDVPSNNHSQPWLQYEDPFLVSSRGTWTQGT